MASQAEMQLQTNLESLIWKAWSETDAAKGELAASDAIERVRILIGAIDAWKHVDQLLSVSPSILGTPMGERVYAEARLQTSRAIEAFTA